MRCIEERDGDRESGIGVPRVGSLMARQTRYKINLNLMSGFFFF